jgi:uncharacterized membrane protein YbhN (UPF0104 family)
VRHRRVAAGVLGLLLGGAALVWMGRTLDLAALRRSAAAVPLWQWGLASAGIWLSYALRAARLHAEWQPRTGARYAECLQLFLLHNAAAAWLPMRSGEAGYPLWLHRRWQVPPGESLRSLLWLRVQDALVLALLSAALWAALAADLPATAALPTAALTVGGVGAVAVRFTRRGSRRGWLCCLGNWVVKLTVIAGLLAAVGALPGGAALRGALGGEWAGVLPLQAPGGLGSYEAGVWAASGRSQTALATVVGAALLVHALTLGLAGLTGLAAIAASAFSKNNTRPQPTP